ncbi:MAG: methyltransferase type 11, partial [Planctomycetes bacterium]|nr:methyltransferase type 11 [Planctomycetota bacterium]
LGHEDEPFSYLLASRDGARSGGWRVVAPAQRVRHEMIFSACGASGIERRTVSKRDAERWTTAKRLEWGDLLDEHPED